MCHFVPTGLLYKTVRSVPLGSHRTPVYKTALCATWFSQDVSIKHCAFATCFPQDVSIQHGVVANWFPQDVCIEECAVGYMLPTGHLYKKPLFVPLFSHRTSLYKTALCANGHLYISVRCVTIGSTGLLFKTLRCVSLRSHRTSL